MAHLVISLRPLKTYAADAGRCGDAVGQQAKAPVTAAREGGLPRLRQLVLMTVMAPAEETGEVVQVAVSESALSIDDGVVAFEVLTAGQSG